MQVWKIKLHVYESGPKKIKDSSHKITWIPHIKSPTFLTDKSHQIRYHYKWLGRKESGDLNRSQKWISYQGSHRRTINETGVTAGFNFFNPVSTCLNNQKKTLLQLNFHDRMDEIYIYEN
jgi:hypothetical protein